MRILPVIAFLIVLVSACSGSVATDKTTPVQIKGCQIIESVPETAPDWTINTPAEDSAYSYDVGRSKKFADEQNAAEDAKRDAIKGFVLSCGVRYDYFDSFVETIDHQSSANALTPTVSGQSKQKQTANAFVSGIKVKSRYLEKHQCQSQGLIDNRYKVYVLVSVPLNECDNVKAWLAAEKAKLTKDLDQLIRDAKQMASQKQYSNAVNTLLAAVNRIKASNFASIDFNYRYAVIQTLRKSYLNETYTRRINRMIGQANELFESGNFLKAVQLLKEAKGIIHTEITDKTAAQNLNLAVSEQENNYINRLRVEVVDDSRRLAEPGSSMPLLKVKVSLTTGKNDQRPLSGFPLVFKSESLTRSRSTDSSGIAILRLPAPPRAGQLTILARPDVARLEEHLSPDAASVVVHRQVQFHITIRKLTLKEKMTRLLKALFVQYRQTNPSEPLEFIPGPLAALPSGCENAFLQQAREAIRQESIALRDIKFKTPSGTYPNISSEARAHAMKMAEAEGMPVLFGSAALDNDQYVLTVTLVNKQGDLASAKLRVNYSELSEDQLNPICQRDQSVLALIKPLKSPTFPFALELENQTNGNQRILSITTTCGQRCYLKIFNLDADGDAIVWEDTKTRRLIRNRAKTILVAAEPGSQQVMIIASTKPFVRQFELNQKLDSAEFLAAIKQMRQVSGSYGEMLKSITIE